jgi:hypothetical protein
LSKFHCTKTVAIEVVKIVNVDINGLGTNLEIGDLFLELLFPDAIQLSLEALIFSVFLFLCKTLIFGLLDLSSSDTLSSSILLFFPGLDL